MVPLPKLLILLVASGDGILVAALPAPTQVASSVARLVYHHKKRDIAGQTRSSFFYAFCHSIFLGHVRVLPSSTAIANTGQPVLVSRQRCHSDLAFCILIELCDCTSRSAGQVPDRRSQSSQSTSSKRPQIQCPTTRSRGFLGHPTTLVAQLVSLSRR
jgi:hypothetical protein